MADPYYGDNLISRPLTHDGLPRNETPIVPNTSIAGHALIAVVAIMTFLASLTIGAVMLVLASAAEWQSEIAREITIQVRPTEGHNIDAEVAKAVQLARGTRGVAEVRPYSKEESTRLLEPWLGGELTLDALPVPRLIVLRAIPGQTVDQRALRAALGEQVVGASLDDHRGWVDHMRAMAATAVIGGLAILSLVLVATALSVAFATRSAMATNRGIIEILHFIGANDAFIAGQFQGHFLVLGLKGGIIGGGAALILLALAGLLADWFLSTPGGEQTAALFGTFSIGVAGYAAVIGQIILTAGVTAGTSRQVVKRMLATIE